MSIRYREVEQSCEEETQPQAASPADGAVEVSFTLPASVIEFLWNASHVELRPTKGMRGGLPRAMGRPRLEDRAKSLAHQKPWKAAGMSRSTWYRRRKEKQNKAQT